MPKKNNPKQQIPFKKKPSPIMIIIMLVAIMTLFFFAFGDESIQGKTEEVSLTAFQANIEEGKYKTIEVYDQELVGVPTEDGAVKEKTFKGNESLKDLGLLDLPENQDVSLDYKNTTGQKFWMGLLGDLLPIILIVGIIIFFMSRMGKNSGGPFSFGQSKAKQFDRRKKKTKFTDVAGAHEAKEDLVEIVDFLKNPKKYTKLGAKIPRGVLLIGAPGTGKTLLARAVAGEANAPFFSISGSEFVEMFVGVGASRVRDLFAKAKKAAPAIIFIDEIDAIGKQRGGAGFGGGHDEREQTLNQILTEMDGFDNETNVIIMAATNRPDVLDKALLRTGRFDRRVTVDMPDLQAREEILKVHAKNKPMAAKTNFTDIAKITVGFSGADLESVMNEAAIAVAKENKKKITREDLSQAVEKITLGRERKAMIMKPEAKKKTAYHEAGHAIVAHLLPYADPVHKVTIISRGMALGVTWIMAEEDRYSISESKFLDDICVSLGGFAAEEIIFGEHETGVSNDLQKATKLARDMATKYGMAPSLGPVSFSDPKDMAGFDQIGVKGISDSYAEKIDIFVQETIEKSLKRTVDLLKKHKKTLEEMADTLLEKETLNKEEFLAFFPETKKAVAAKTGKKRVKKTEEK